MDYACFISSFNLKGSIFPTSFNQETKEQQHWWTKLTENWVIIFKTFILSSQAIIEY